MLVQSIGLKQGSGPVSINSTFTDLKIYGMTDYTIKKVVPDLGNYRLDFEGELPALHNEGGYSISGKILVLPITGQGKSWSNYTVKASLICSPKTKGNKLYWNVDDFMFDLDVKNAIIHMDNLFNGNKELGDAMNAFMSENWEVVFKELKPVVNEAVSALLKDVAVKVFSRFPIDQLLPD
ncbi:hypothetical protein AAG570_000526 [Ranatra chinensis]|uniref:Protein takeout n=1 Tax=Ranatra chinensis TaxID=642074 RepID=A0ABD0YXA7_9HEMI